MEEEESLDNLDEEEESLDNLGETESTDSSSSDSNPVFYDNDESLPVHEWGLVKGKTIIEIAEILLNISKTTKVATTVPTNVSKNTTFLIDASCLDNIEDLKCDDLGIWHCTGVKTDFFKIKSRKVKKVDTKKQSKPGVFKFTRRYYSNDNVTSLKKTITTVTEADHVCYRYAFIQYIFTDGEQTVCPRPHAKNKTSNKPYMRTKKSTLDKIRNDLSTHDPRKIIHNVIDDLGGIEKVRSGSDIPRNRKQVYNTVQSLSKSDKISDPLANLMQKCKEELRDEKTALIRSVQVTPEPIIFLSTEQQLKDIERFCTNPEMFCVLGVDATFELCDYYMTFVTYRNPMLKTKSGNSPAIVGPGILHKTKLERSYQILGAEMVRWHPPCAGVLVLGSDGELNMINALLRTFSSAVHLRCDLHMKDNISSKLSSLGIPHSLSKEYMADIFGKGEEGGLIHCLSPLDFDDALGKIIPTWEERHTKGAEFVKYFAEKKAADMKETMTVEIRSLCGLGFPPEVYTQNASESMNRVLKEEDQDCNNTRRAKKSVCDIVERFRKVVKRQEQEQFMSVMRIGEYEIKERFKSLEIGERYFRMNERQKETVKKNFFNCSLTDKKFKNTFDEHISLPTEEALLSIQIKDFKIGTVPFLVLNDMYQDAANLVRGENTVVKSPSFEPDGKNEVWMVASRRAPGKPHNVTASKTGRVVCDKGCVGWAQYSICCHALAVAENLGILRKFLEWLQKNKKTGSTTKMANVGMPKTSGQKAKATQKRKGNAKCVSDVTTTFPCVSRVPDVMPPAEAVRSDTATNLATTNTEVSAALSTSSTPKQPTLCSPQSLPTMGFFGSALTHFPQHTAQPFFPIPPINTSFTSTFPLPVQQETANSSEQGIQSSQPAFRPQSNGRPDPNPGSFEVTLLHLCDPRVQKCHGCGQPIRSPGMMIPPPGDIIVVTKMRRDFFLTSGEKRQGKVGNVYFHCHTDCIRSKCPYFFPSLLYVRAHVRSLLLSVHRQHLVTSLGFAV